MDKFELTSENMQIIMLCLRGEYETVAAEADALHDLLVGEGFSAFDNAVPAVLTYKL